MTDKIQVKDGEHLNGQHMRPWISAIVTAAYTSAPHFTDDTLWITAANGPGHKVGSKHYTDEAFDFRTRNIAGTAADIPRAAQQWAARIRLALGRLGSSGGHPLYDVVVEVDHIHIEYDPKP